jgi:hypothetical protein
MYASKKTRISRFFLDFLLGLCAVNMACGCLRNSKSGWMSGEKIFYDLYLLCLIWHYHKILITIL